MKNKLLKMLTIFASLTVCAGCGEPDDTSFDPSEEITEDVTISFFGWGSQEEQHNFQELVDAFMQENPKVKVVYSATDSGTYMNTLKNKANNLPDVFYMPDYEFMQWADTGKLLALDNYMTNEEISSMWQMSTEMYRYDADSYTLGEGKLFGLPKDLGPYTLVYNKTLLEQIMGANVEYPSGNDPMSWNEFTTYLGKLKAPGVYPIGYYELMAAVYSNNADFFDAAVEKERISEKNFIDAVQFIADLTHNGLAPTANEQSEQNSFQRFVTGNCVFTFMGPWDMATFWKDVPFEYDIIPVPYGPAEGARSTAWVGSVAFCVSAKSKQKQAAVKLAKFLACSERANKMNADLGQAVPNMKEYAENYFVPGVGMTEEQKKSPTNRQLFIDIIEGATNPESKIGGKQRARYFLYLNTCYDDLESSLSTIYEGSKTAEQHLKSYAATFQKGLDDSNEEMGKY